MNCFECDINTAHHNHHVIPRSLGGTKTIPLCTECHGKVHGLNFKDHGILTKAGLKKKKENREFYGKVPYGFYNINGVLHEHKEEQENIKLMRSLRDLKFSFRKISNALEERSIRTREDKKFSHSSVHIIISRKPNHFYKKFKVSK